MGVIGIEKTERRRHQSYLRQGFEEHLGGYGEKSSTKSISETGWVPSQILLRMFFKLDHQKVHLQESLIIIMTRPVNRRFSPNIT